LKVIPQILKKRKTMIIQTVTTQTHNIVQNLMKRMRIKIKKKLKAVPIQIPPQSRIQLN
jgi:hypothetical protein